MILLMHVNDKTTVLFLLLSIMCDNVLRALQFYRLVQTSQQYNLYMQQTPEWISRF